jgi:hypothetical protein
MVNTSKIKPLRVLFIGNSFTARNGLPGLIASLAGARLEYRLISRGGASLRTHWNAGEARRAIERGRWDYVVLQEQSTLPIKNPSRMRENVLLFDEVIKGEGARTALYLTWARQRAPETQDAITKAYVSVGQEIEATVIPVGVAWQNLLRKHEKPVLYDRDQSHPTMAGSYLAACVAFGVFFPGHNLSDAAPVKGLTTAEVKLLQRFA